MPGTEVTPTYFRHGGLKFYFYEEQIQVAVDRDGADEIHSLFGDTKKDFVKWVLAASSTETDRAPTKSEEALFGLLKVFIDLTKANSNVLHMALRFIEDREVREDCKEVVNKTQAAIDSLREKLKQTEG